jgi:hypothetical protein
VLVYVPLGLLIMWWFNGMILKGKNWARILQLLGVVGAPLTAYLVLASPVYASDRILPLVGLCASWPLYAWACWLVFTSPGKEWFRKRARRGGAASGE